MIKYLKFDSKFFDKKIFQIKLKSNDNLNELKKEIKKLVANNFDCAYLEVENSDKNIIKYCKKNYILTQKKIILRKKILKNKIGIIPDEISTKLDKKRKKDLDQVAGQLSGKSRFSFDPNLKQKSKLLYQKWIQKSVFGSFALKYFAYKKNKNVIGFLSLRKRKNNLSIDLFVVDKKNRKKGIGTKLLKACFSWAAEKRHKYLYVSTQKSNIKALNIYQKNGFLKKESYYTFHIWRKRT